MMTMIMRKDCDREEMVEVEKTNGERNSPLMSLPVHRLNGDRLQCQRLCQYFSFEWICLLFQLRI